MIGLGSIEKVLTFLYLELIFEIFNEYRPIFDPISINHELFSIFFL